MKPDELQRLRSEYAPKREGKKDAKTPATSLPTEEGRREESENRKYSGKDSQITPEENIKKNSDRPY